MSEQTVKLAGWRPQQRPVDDGELAAYRQLVVEAVFGVYYRKRALLAERQMPAQPVSLSEIYLEVRSRVAQLRACGLWRYAVHGKRWLDRRVNEAACPRYAADGVPRIVAVSAGLYAPNPALFAKAAEVRG